MEIIIALTLFVVVLVMPVLLEYRRENRAQQVLVRVQDAEHFRKR